MADENPSENRSEFPIYGLHKAAFTGDIHLMKALLEQPFYLETIDRFDERGNSALHIAAHFGNVQIVQLMLEAGANATLKNGGGWSALHESLGCGSFRTSLMLLCATQRKIRAEFQKRCSKVSSELEKLPDFYLELSWAFHSWVPLVSRFCPNDSYKIWKKGTSVRVDTTLAGMENNSWQRANTTFLFTGQNASRPGELVVLDHDKEIMQWANDIIMNTNAARRETQFMMASEIQRTKINSQKISFTPCKTWLGYQKTERVCGLWDSVVYNTGNVSINTTVRADSTLQKRQMRKNKMVTKEEYISFEDYFTDQEPMKGMLWPSESVNLKSREFQGNDFPLEVKDLLPILSLLSPSSRHVKKLEDFLELKMPEEGFPVKLNIPIFPSVSVTASFGKFEEWEETERDEEKIFFVPDYRLETREEYNARHGKKKWDKKGKGKEGEKEGENEEEEEGENGKKGKKKKRKREKVKGRIKEKAKKKKKKREKKKKKEKTKSEN